MTSGPRRILVTGGARRVGRRFVERLSAAGHSVVIHANASAVEAEELCRKLRADNPNTWTLKADLSDHATACALVDQAAQLAGGQLSLQRIGWVERQLAALSMAPCADAPRSMSRRLTALR